MRLFTENGYDRTTMRSIAAEAGVSVGNADLKVDPELREELPELLWLFQMGVVLFWVHDRSQQTKRTRMLVRRTVPLIARLAGLSRLRVLRPITRELLSLIHDLAKKD